MTRVLKTNDTNTIPGAIVIVEVATFARPSPIDPAKTVHTLRRWVAISGRMESGKWTREKIRYGSTAAEFWQFIEFARQSGHPTTICGYTIHHSVSMLGFWAELDSGRFCLNRPAHPDWAKQKSSRTRRSMARTTKGLLISATGLTAIVCYHKLRWKLTIVDCRNYLDRSPEQVSELTGTEFRDWPADDAPIGEWDTVLLLRCLATKAVFQGLVVWQNRQELGKFSLTISSLAMAAFRHRFMRHRIELPEDQDIRDWQRQGYYNGRVECLWQGRIEGGRYTPPPGRTRSGTLFDEHPCPPFYVVDARSFYAAVHINEDYPIRCEESHLGGRVPVPPNDGSLIELMATVEVASQYATYPVRMERGAIHAKGIFQTTLCGPELLRAAMAGHVKKWIAWQRYTLAPILRQYGQSIWDERVRAEQAGEPVVSSLCKALLARIHGKFLQKAHRWTLLPGRVAPGAWEHWDAIDCATGRHRNFRSIGWDVQIEDDAGDAEWCFPAIAAWVTAHGREYLRSWVATAGRHHTLYVGCDCLIVDKTGLDNLTAAGIIRDGGAGSLRVTRTVTDIEIRGPNNYTVDGHDVVAGRSLSAVKIIDRRWTAQRWQSLEEIFLRTDKSAVTTYPVHGNAAVYSITGTVGAGGWIDPPTIELEKMPCPKPPPQMSLREQSALALNS